MRILVTGASGFVAPYVVQELMRHGHEVLLTAPEPLRIRIPGASETYLCNLRDLESTRSLIRATKPEGIIHLAAMSHVGKSWENRAELIDVNVNATSHLCNVATALGREMIFLFVSSAMVYGSQEGDNVFDESIVPTPTTPYGASKMASEYVVRSYASDKFRPYIVRPFNHIGPGQSKDFVCSAFATKVLETPSGGTIKVGNLDAERDFSDVRDIARAYRLVLEKLPAETLFVLGSGQGMSVRSILDYYIQLSGKDLTHVVDQSLLRPKDPKRIVADPALAQRVLGWKVDHPIKNTLREIFDWTRTNTN